MTQALAGVTMTRYLVAYYSWFGTTAKAAEAIAAALGADVEEITDAKPRRGLFVSVRSAIEAGREKPAPIMTPERNIADYDVVILGFPVWASNMASPMRGYIERALGGAKPKSIAAFCTLGSSGAEKAFEKIEAACVRKLAGTVAFNAEEMKKGDWREKAEAFASALKSNARLTVVGANAA
ncbi:MAG: flavodoxin [Pseudomonadota bacterium]